MTDAKMDLDQAAKALASVGAEGGVGEAGTNAGEHHCGAKA